MFERIRTFLRESRQEFKRVNWPTRREIVKYTLFVIGIAVALAIFLGLLDYLFLQVLERII